MEKLYYPFMRDFTITSEYGPRGEGFHNGVDFAIPEPTNLLGVAKWDLARFGYDANGYGNYMILDHAELGISTLYAHLRSKAVVKTKGEALDFIALSGNTGVSTGPHLHFEVRNTLYKPGYFDKYDNGQFKNSVNPRDYLPSPWYQKQFLKYKEKYNLDNKHKPEGTLNTVEQIIVMERIIKQTRLEV